jgi:integrase
MASIRPNDPDHPGPFRIDFKHTNRRDGTQIRGSLTRDTWPEAQIVAGDAEKDIREGQHPYDRYNIAPTTTALTFGAWTDRWRVDRGLIGAGDKVERSIIRLYLLPTFRTMPLESIGRLAVQQWVTRLSAEGNAPRYVRRIYGVFRKIVGDAVDDPTVTLDSTPCVRIMLPDLDSTGRRALTVDEVAAICSRCAPYTLAAWSLAFTGMRVGELLKRDVGDWSPFTGITIAGRPIAEARARGKRKARTRASKTVAGGRTVPLCGSHGRAIRDYTDGRMDGPLLRGERVARLGYDVFLDVFTAATEAAGLPDVTPHWFRGTLKTWIREDGCDQRAVDYMLGHRTHGMDGIYVDVTPAMLRKITDALEVRWVAAHASSRIARAAGE